MGCGNYTLFNWVKYARVAVVLWIKRLLAELAAGVPFPWSPQRSDESFYSNKRMIRHKVVGRNQT